MLKMPEHYVAVLIRLAEEPQRTVTRGELKKAMEEGLVSDDVLNQAIHEHRKIFGATAIRTIRGRGYSLMVLPVTIESSSAGTQLPPEAQWVYVHPNGWFAQYDAIWKEHRKDIPDRPFIFKELRRDPDYIYLYDESRAKKPGHPMYLRIPIAGGVVQWTYPNPLEWEDLLIVDPRRAADFDAQSDPNRGIESPP